MTFEDMARERYSVKQYGDRPVEDQKLRHVLEVANLAPTAKDAQCVRTYVLRSPEALARVRELTPCTYGAPVVLMLAYDEDEAYRYPRQDQRDSGAEDCAIVATHVMFAALEEGLGTCWVNNFTPAEAHDAFGLPANEHVVLLMDLGYAAESAGPLAKHAQRKPLDEVVHEL